MAAVTEDDTEGGVRYQPVAVGEQPADPSGARPARTRQYYFRKIALRTMAMLLLLCTIFGLVYVVATVHDPAPELALPPVVRPWDAPPERPIRVPGLHSHGSHGSHGTLGIMNGGAAKPGQFPWLVDIQVIDTGQSKCAGSLIDPNWVITAAHCVSTMPSADLRIVMGEHDIALHDEFEQISSIKKVVIEPDFSTRAALPNDIALLQLETPAVFNERVTAIQLTRDDSSFSACSVAGWGAAGVDPVTGQPVYPTALQTVNMTLLSRDACQSQLIGYVITVNMTCAEGEDGADVCWGDSGGSLTCPPIAAPAPWTLVGVTSWGVACGYMQYPSVYTRVSRFIPWIEAVAGVVVPPAPAR
ncbi:chymotrypsinogen B-like [Pollicipes pollicipes]|uniref:chymotrypsinogen B-like n=1 Tax=Pollicipes pollicipes TaxID=41117 RepID=UPI00188574B4|nr:chymotrypsinogen B-like [Pollicipes pollicipes]